MLTLHQAQIVLDKLLRLYHQIAQLHLTDETTPGSSDQSARQYIQTFFTLQLLQHAAREHHDFLQTAYSSDLSYKERFIQEKKLREQLSALPVILEAEVDADAQYAVPEATKSTHPLINNFLEIRAKNPDYTWENFRSELSAVLEKSDTHKKPLDDLIFFWTLFSDANTEPQAKIAIASMFDLWLLGQTIENGELNFASCIANFRNILRIDASFQMILKDIGSIFEALSIKTFKFLASNTTNIMRPDSFLIPSAPRTIFTRDEPIAHELSSDQLQIFSDTLAAKSILLTMLVFLKEALSQLIKSPAMSAYKAHLEALFAISTDLAASIPQPATPPSSPARAINLGYSPAATTPPVLRSATRRGSFPAAFEPSSLSSSIFAFAMNVSQEDSASARAQNGDDDIASDSEENRRFATRALNFSSS